MNIVVKHFDRADIPEVFADGIHSVVMHEGALRLEFTVTRMDEPRPPAAPTMRALTAARLVLTPGAAINLQQQLAGLLAALQKQGVLHVAPVTPPPATPANRPN